jgi:DNA invertase Pin-like site-specific DNA recombinase
MRKYLYIRCSTKEQNEASQLALKDKYGLRSSDIFIDKATGKNFDRPQYQKLKAELQKGDTLIVFAIDRLGRNKQQALAEIREFQAKGIRLIVDDIPTTQIEVDEKNKLMIEMINNILIEVYTSLAEEELRKIKTRQAKGIEAMPLDINNKRVSLKTGRLASRPSKIDNLTKEQEKNIRAWMEKKISMDSCIKLTELSRATIFRAKKKLLEKEI